MFRHTNPIASTQAAPPMSAMRVILVMCLISSSDLIMRIFIEGVSNIHELDAGKCILQAFSENLH